MTVFHATRNAYQHMGLVPPSRRLRHTQLEHDLHCTSIYIHLRLEHHHDAHNWVSDDLWKRLVHRRFVKKRFVAKPPAEKVPDAHLVQNGTPYRVIDFGGSYSAARVDALIDYAQATNLPIQIW